MYSNIGEKIQKLAKICGIFGILCITGGLIFLVGLFLESEEWAWPIECGIILYGVLSFIGSWPLYAFGQITNDIHAMRTKDFYLNSDDVLR